MKLGAYSNSELDQQAGKAIQKILGLNHPPSRELAHCMVETLGLLVLQRMNEGYRQLEFGRPGTNRCLTWDDNDLKKLYDEYFLLFASATKDPR